MMTKRDWRAFYRMAAKHNVSNRVRRSWLALSRTLADLDEVEVVTMHHIVEGLALLNPNRKEYGQDFDAVKGRSSAGKDRTKRPRA